MFIYKYLNTFFHIQEKHRIKLFVFHRVARVAVAKYSKSTVRSARRNTGYAQRLWKAPRHISGFIRNEANIRRALKELLALR